jgi:hypothetical protein
MTRCFFAAFLAAILLISPNSTTYAESTVVHIQAEQDLVPCNEWFVGMVEQTGLDELDLFPYVGCRQVKSQSGWFQGKAGIEEQFIVEIPDDQADLIAEGVKILRDSLQKMFEHPYLTKYIDFDMNTCELTYGRWYRSAGEPSTTEDFLGSTFLYVNQISNTVYEDYTSAVILYVGDPSNKVVGEYIRWFASARDSAVNGALSLIGLEPLSDQAIRNRADVGYLPLPWHLSDKSLLEFYVSWVIETYGIASLSAPIPSPAA